jgi:hypothetical protein
MASLKPRGRYKKKYTPVTCKYCGGQDTTRYGQYKGVRRYWCYDCQRKFKDDDSLYYKRTPKVRYSLALRLSTISTYSEIIDKLLLQFGHRYSKCTLFRWFKEKDVKTRGRRRTKKLKHYLLDIEEELAIYANNTGITIIDDLTREIPLSFRSDVRQEAALRYFQQGGDDLSFDVIKNIVEVVIKKSKQEYFENKYSVIYLESKPFKDSDIELVDLIPDKRAELDIYDYCEKP